MQMSRSPAASAFVSVDGVFSGHHLAVVRAAFLTLHPGPDGKQVSERMLEKGSSGAWFVTHASTCLVFIQSGGPSVPGVVITLPAMM